MKTTRQLAAFAAAAAIAAGCNTEKAMPETDMNGVPVRFDMTVGGMPVSKTMTDDGTDGSRAVTWRDGDAVGIFAGDEAVVHQYVYDVQGDGVWKEASAEDAIYAAAGQVYDFSAYYPYCTDIVTADGFILTATVLADQNSRYAETGNSGYDMSDVLYASVTGVDYDQAVSGVGLDYSHAFAMVEVLVSGSDVVNAPEAVRLRNVKPTATVDMMSGTVTLDEAAVSTDIRMCAIAAPEGVAEGSYLYRAIVPAQPVAAGNTLLEIDGIGDVGTYVFRTPASGVTYEQGRYRRIEATVGEGKASLTFPSGSIDSWEPSEELDPVPGEEKTVDLMDGYGIEDLTAETFMQVANAASSLYDPNGAYYVDKTCWAFSKYGSDNADISATLESGQDGQYISISGTFGSFSYYRSALVYHCVSPENFGTGYYRLVFKARKSAEDTQMQQPQVFIRTADSDYAQNGLFILGPEDEPKQGFAPTDEWTEFKMYFNFNRARDSAYDSGNLVENVDFEYGCFDVAFFPVGAVNALDIKGASLVKITEDEFNAAAGAL